MAATASSNLARLRAIKETTFGEVPLVGESRDLRFTGESINYAIQTDTSKEIRADRQIADLVQLGAETSGDIQFELSYGSFDDFMAAAIGGTWEEDASGDFAVLTNGILVPSFSIEKGFTDIDQYIVYRGMSVNTMSLDFQIETILTGSFGFMGRDSIIASTSGVPDVGSAPTLTEVMNSASNFADLIIAGNSYPCGISQVSLNTDAGLRAQKALGNMGACRINAGTFTPTGTLNVYFSDAAIYTKYLQNTPFGVSWAVQDAAGNRYDFSLPKVKITSANPVAGGLDQDVELAIEYQALFDPVAGHTIQIKRTPA